MGLGDMQQKLEHMLDDLQEEIGEDELEKIKKEQKPKEQKESEKDVNIDDLLKGLPDLITREKRKKEIGIQPAWEMPQQQVEQVKSPEKVQPIKSKPTKQEKRSHVLIVDDDIRILKMIKEILKDDYDTAVASNGDIALKFLERHETDLILLDYMMPGKNGKVVLEKIRENPAFANVPVFFLTGMSDVGKVRECLALRPQGYMLKPVKREELLKKLKEILG